MPAFVISKLRALSLNTRARAFSCLSDILFPQTRANLSAHFNERFTPGIIQPNNASSKIRLRSGVVVLRKREKSITEFHEIDYLESCRGLANFVAEFVSEAGIFMGVFGVAIFMGCSLILRCKLFVYLTRAKSSEGVGAFRFFVGCWQILRNEIGICSLETIVAALCFCALFTSIFQHSTFFADFKLRNEIVFFFFDIYRLWE